MPLVLSYPVFDGSTFGADVSSIIASVLPVFGVLVAVALGAYVVARIRELV